MTECDELVPVGKITGTHGIKGLLKVFSYSGNIESLRGAGSVILKGKDGDLRDFAVKSVAPHGGGFLLALDGYTDINRVLTFSGSEICLKRSQLPATDDDEYYWCDLLGLSVVTDRGESLGTIADIFETGSSDIYVVRGNGREYLIPAIADVVSRIDIAGGTMIITPLDGLLDL